MNLDINKEKSFEYPDFYENLCKYLSELDGIELKNVQQGDYVIAFDTWRDPYRVNGEIEYEICLELIVGKVTNPNSLTFSEAFCLNTYHGSLNFIEGKSTWLNGSTSSKSIILIDENAYNDIKEESRIENWKKNPSYNSDIISEFVQLVQTHLKSRFYNITEESAEIPTEDSSNASTPPKAFLHPDFYDLLINILNNKKTCELDDLNLGDVGIIFDVWQTPYNVDGKTVQEESIEVILGKVTNSMPLKLSNTITLNSYHGSISYSKGSTTWSSGSLSATKKITVIEGEFLHRLELELNIKNWGEKTTSYDPKRITKYVRSIENYFNGQFAGKNYEILRREDLVTEIGPNGTNKIISIDILAPEIAKETKPGQFVVLRLHERGERIPLTIADFNREEGTIKLIYQTAGKTTEELATLNAGDFILDLLGPLGNCLRIHKYEKPVICISGGVGLASIYAKTKALKEAGNYIISIVGSRSYSNLVLEKEIRAVSDEMYITTDDGMYHKTTDGREAFHRVKADGSKKYGGFVSNVLEALLGQSTFLEFENGKIDDENKKNIRYGPSPMVGKYAPKDISEIIAVGPILMMKSIVNVVANKVSYNPEQDYTPGQVKTMVNLNPIMMDGTGMCGGCRVEIYDPKKKDYEIKFACIDGPIFDGYLVNFQSLFQRTTQYAPQEVLSEKYLEVLGW